jgi:hypothetical protein
MPEAFQRNLPCLGVVGNIWVGRSYPISAFAVPVTFSAPHHLGANRFFSCEVVHGVRDPFIGENGKAVCGVEKDCHISKDEVFNGMLAYPDYRHGGGRGAYLAD